MRNTIKISDVSDPVVGNSYLVPCIKYDTPIRQWWPVIGEWHEDADLGLPVWHFHFDFRFLEIEGYGMGRVQTSRFREREMPIVWRRMKMLRQMPEFPGRKLTAWKALERKFMELKMKCMTCPHRGMPLQGQPIIDGMVVCNGHGLRWKISTGEMVPR